MKRLSKLLPKIRLPSLPNLTEAVRDLTVVGGFFMVFFGLWRVDYRIALILCGIWLMLPPKGGR